MNILFIFENPNSKSMWMCYINWQTLIPKACRLAIEIDKP